MIIIVFFLSIVGLVHGSLGEHFLMTMDTVDK